MEGSYNLKIKALVLLGRFKQVYSDADIGMEIHLWQWALNVNRLPGWALYHASNRNHLVPII